jgi:hypothetical protein
MQTITEILGDLEHQRFYGTLEVKLEAGKIVLLRKTETIKPAPDYRDNRGMEHEYQFPHSHR